MSFTGVFTAPVRGVYHFVLFVLGANKASISSGVSLYKNKEKILNVWSHQARGFEKSSNGASLLLEVGDVVYVKLMTNAWVYDNQDHHTTFSGHLLFPL